MASRPLPDTACQMRSSYTGNRDRSDGSRLAADVGRWHFAALRVQAPCANDFPSPSRPLCVSTHLTLGSGASADFGPDEDTLVDRRPRGREAQMPNFKGFPVTDESDRRRVCGPRGLLSADAPDPHKPFAAGLIEK